ncbi:hypothetical protein AB1Y20_018849 [Prymnesium parvum]|uniref:Bifunctional lysine-specific demethylase and histidyl-hydroxylase n=1 Tax=Prymnesium parvum TaxID=97485 RepID=A0AB34JSH6_PRYPA
MLVEGHRQELTQCCVACGVLADVARDHSNSSSTQSQWLAWCVQGALQRQGCTDVERIVERELNVCLGQFGMLARHVRLIAAGSPRQLFHSDCVQPAKLPGCASFILPLRGERLITVVDEDGVVHNLYLAPGDLLVLNGGTIHAGGGLPVEGLERLALHAFLWSAQCDEKEMQRQLALLGPPLVQTVDELREYQLTAVHHRATAAN